MRDTVYCKGLRLRVRIGFHEFERNIEQALKVDLELHTDFGRGPGKDRHEGLLDYYVLTEHLQKHVTGRPYELIEAVAVDMARETVRMYPDVTVRVRVEKIPLDMPMVEAVAVECTRCAADFADEGR